LNKKSISSRYDSIVIWKKYWSRQVDFICRMVVRSPSSIDLYSISSRCIYFISI